MEHSKHPRTLHLPWSPGFTPDDVRLADASRFVGRRVVVTEKMDGECTAVYKDGSHARSLDSRHHPSRAHVKQLQARLAADIPENRKLVGENCYAKHSISYSALPAWFLLFGIFIEETEECFRQADGSMLWCAAWDEVEFWAAALGIPTVPVLYRGLWDEEKVRACMTGRSRYGGEQEGYVVRVETAFPASAFAQCVAKYVRAGHVQTDEHWMHTPVVVNGRR